jgi:hypothetical protein
MEAVWIVSAIWRGVELDIFGFCGLGRVGCDDLKFIFIASRASLELLLGTFS